MVKTEQQSLSHGGFAICQEGTLYPSATNLRTPGGRWHQPTFQMTKLRPKQLKAFARGQAAGKWQSRALIPGWLAPQPLLSAAWLHIRWWQENLSRREIRGTGQEVVSVSQGKSPRHWAGAGFSFLVRETLFWREGRGSCIEVRDVAGGWWVMHQFSGEAFNLISLF